MSSTCRVCPHNCILFPGQIGKCLVRQNIENKVVPIYEGECSILSVDPIEKRPLFHFLPGEKFLSVGLLGCSFSCKFCQTFNISQSTHSKTTHLSPQELVDLALSKNVSGIAFTFNEPTIHYEYIMDVGDKAKNAGLRIVVKSNGFINKHILDDLDLVIDAWNIDIKGDHSDYISTCSGSIQPVLLTIELLASRNRHVEISYLVLPEHIDNVNHHILIRDWLYNLSSDIPVHLLYFYPCHNKKDAKYEPDKLLDIKDIFVQKMSFVYISNIFNSNLIQHRNTYCPTCNNLLISRQSNAIINNLDCCDFHVKGQFRNLGV